MIRPLGGAACRMENAEAGLTYLRAHLLELATLSRRHEGGRRPAFLGTNRVVVSGRKASSEGTMQSSAALLVADLHYGSTECINGMMGEGMQDQGMSTTTTTTTTTHTQRCCVRRWIRRTKQSSWTDHTLWGFPTDRTRSNRVCWCERQRKGNARQGRQRKAGQVV